MERLTCEGNYCELELCSPMLSSHACIGGYCSNRKVWERLKAYEDTGLEPAMCANYKTFEDEAISKGVTFKRIVELMEADKDGRVVVVPCKDCKNYPLWSDGRAINHCDKHECTMYDDDFCSYGERKDEPCITP